MPAKPAKNAASARKAAKSVLPRRIRRLSPAERRLQIIDAARALFAEGGLAQVTMRNIARHVGITQAAIYQHFEDKEAVLFAIADGFFAQLIERMQRRLAEDMAPLDRLRAMMRGYIEAGLARPEEYRLVFMTDIPGFKRHVGLRVDPSEDAEPSTGQLAFAILEEQVRALVRARLIRPGDAEITAEAIWAAGHGVVSLLITHVGFLWAPEKLIDAQIEMIFNGILPDDSLARRKAPQARSPKA